MMTSDPSPLFLAAALTAGIIEGSSVIRNYLHYASPPTNDDNNNDNNDNNDNDGRNNIADEYYNNDSVAATPSASTIIAHSILYGVTSVPLGIVGASPGLVFLPKFKSSSFLSSSRIKTCVEGGNPAAIEDAIDKGEERTVHNTKYQYQRTLDDLSDTYPDDNISIVGTGRGVGRMLRHENSMKMTLHNKRQRHLGGIESGKRNQTNIGGTTAVTPRPSTYTGVSSRYIATLDGKALPTQLAEAMRRMRFIFVGAGIVSYAITTRHMNMTTKNHYRHDNAMESRHHPTYAATYYCYGYNHWIMNTKSIRLWNERIKHGKSMNEIDLLKRWKMQQNDINESIVYALYFGILSNESPIFYYRTAQEVIYGGIYNTTKWMHEQLGRDLDEPPFGWVRHWKTADRFELTKGESNIGEESTQSGSRRYNDDDEATEQVHIPSSSKSDSEQQSQNSSPVWNAVVTSVGVLGTSVRHLVVSTYQLATTVATAGRQGKRAPKDNDVDAK